MSIKEKMKSYNFWVSLASAVILILKVIGAQVGFTIDANFANDLITSLCSILVLLGIIVTPTSASTKTIKDIASDNIASKNTTTDSEPAIENEVYEEITDSTKEEQKANDIDENSLVETGLVKDVIDNQTDVVLENSQNSQTENNQEVITEETNTICNNYLEFENLLKLQKEKFANDIETYIGMLESEINNYKNNRTE